MLTNYFKIAWRNLRRHKGYVLLNIFGLAIGLGGCLLIGIHIYQEVQFDRFHEDADEIVRIVRATEQPPSSVDAGIRGNAEVPPGVSRTVEEQIPGLESLTNIHTASDVLFQVNGESHVLNRVYAADSTFFDVFSFELVHGDAESIFRQLDEAVLTESVANRFFGDADVVGREFDRLDEVSGQSFTYRVAGVMKDPPENSSLKPTLLTSFSPSQLEGRGQSSVEWNWWIGGGYVFAKLSDHVDKDHVHQSLTEIGDPDEGQHLAVIPFTSTRLQSNLNAEIAATGDLQYLYLFGAVGLIILLIAIINYMNLSTARTERRAKEVGVRKVMGAQRSQVAGQFLAEAVLISLLALPLAVLAARLSLPSIESITGLSLTLSPLWSTGGLVFLLVTILLIGVIAGVYPAIRLSIPGPMSALQGFGLSEGARKGVFRQTLVVTQFSVSIALIVCTLIIYYQLQYVQDANLGFNTEYVVTFTTGNMDDDYSIFRDQIDQDTRIQSVTSGPPLGLNRKNMTMSVDHAETQESYSVNILNIDYDYLETLDLQIVEGRDFSRDLADAGRGVVLSESAAEVFRRSGGALVGETIELNIPSHAAGAEQDDEDKVVVGIVEDFHNASMRSEVEPVVFFLNPGNNWTGLARLAPGNISEGLAALESAWNAVLPDRPFEARFLDERVQAQYTADQRRGELLALFAALAILIACLGLFGLAAFAAERRKKEIGIRKVLGATAQSIVALLSKDFLKLVLIGFVLAAPVAYYAMSRWLEDFAYRIDIGPMVFILAGLAALAIALLTVSYQALKAAWMNPTEAIQKE